MRPLSVLFLALLLHPFLSPSQETSFSERLKKTDKIKNDSAALISLESFKKSDLNEQDYLQVNYRIIIRAMLSQQFSKAVSVGLQSIDIANKKGLDSLSAVFYEQLGNAYYFLEQKEKAIEQYKKAISICSKKGYWFIEGCCYNNIGAALIDLNNTSGAEGYLFKSIGIMEAHGPLYDSFVSRSKRILATLYMGSNEKDKAELMFKDLIQKSKQTKDTSLLCDVLMFYSTLKGSQGDTLQAVSMSAEALNYMRKRNNFHELLAIIQFHARNLTNASRYKEAYDLEAEAYELQKKSFAKDLEKEVGEVEVKYKTAQIRQEKELSETKSKKQQQVFLFLFSGLLLLSLSIYFIIHQRKNSQQRMALQKQRLEVLIEGEEKERVRIARDLHDGIVQNLTAVKLKLNSIKPNAAGNEENLKELVSEIDLATKEVRNIAYKMMPLALKECGLLPALEDLLNKSLNPLSINFEFESIGIEQRLPEKYEINLYRITQELLNNVIKHSKATQVSVLLSLRNYFITLVFEDNGKGFLVDTKQNGIGLSSLKSRIELLNGDLKYESGTGAGTTVIVKLPFAI
ncbi:MAG: hypothetical protein JWO32_705 [Bacteroidetes bacterium]|nr:hypothetical protein [Bacteroidota bacterium]